MEKTTTPAPRLAALDLLRGLAVLLVLGRHMPKLAPGAVSAPLQDFLDVWLRVGWIGVDLFFVLSGFLISGLLFRESQRFGEIRYGHFLARRAFKIYPAFYLMFAAVLIFGACHGRPFVGWPVILSEMFFVQNYGPALFPHAWSLAVEEHFYLLLPLLLLALRGREEKPFAALPGIFVGLALLVALGRELMAATPFRFKTHLFATHLRIDALMFGVLLGWLYAYHREPLFAWVKRWRWGLAFFVPVAVAPALVLEIEKSRFLQTHGLIALYLAAGALLLLALHFQPRARWLAFVGAYSYSIYLWHIPVRFFGLTWLSRDTSPLAYFAAYFVLSLGIGVLVAWLIERPFLAWRDRLVPSRSLPGATETSGPIVLAPELAPALPKAA